MKKLILLFVLMLPLAVHAQIVTGLEGASGSAIGPGRALYVTENYSPDDGVTWIGRISRVDPRYPHGVTTFADGLPSSPLQGLIGFGGVVDVAFLGRKAYVLVTAVGAPFGTEIDGIYRVDGPNSFTVIADIGEFSFNNPPMGFPYDLPNGLQYALETYRGGFLVTDGHHNRVLRVTRHGEISEYFAFNEDVVPTGLEVSRGKVYLAEAGPIPHLPEDGKIVAFGHRSSHVKEVASGAPLLVDVERGRGRTLFALSQGVFPDDGFPAQSANENTGALLKVNRHGEFTPIADGLNLPTSLEIIRNTAYIVTLSGDVLKFDHLVSNWYHKYRYHGDHDDD